MPDKTPAVAEPRRTSVTPKPLAPSPLLSLQASAGNAAVTRMLRGVQETTRQVQRWEGPEHEQLGNATGATIDLGNGVVLTWGDVVAIAGDEYGSVEELRRDTTTHEGRQRLRARLQHDRVQDPHVAALPKPTKAQSEDTSRYDQLAIENVPHFAAGGTAFQTWRRHHMSALQGALESGFLGSEEQWQQAQLVEAFGQHFLTDSFSAGHVRTPRTEILAWYRDDFAPRAISAFLTNARNRLAHDITDQANYQSLLPRHIIESTVRGELQVVIAAFAEKIRIEFTPLFGVGLAGLLSGTLHDVDNRTGLRVASRARPEGWLTYGDGKLSESPESQEEAGKAVRQARNELLLAQRIGSSMRRGELVVPSTLPTTLHFPFDSAALMPDDVLALQGGGPYLVANPEMAVSVVGHTDPLGGDAYNLSLGLRRANFVAQVLTEAGAPATAVRTSSLGERNPVTADPVMYSLDRRAELHWEQFRSPGAAATPDLARAQAELAAQVPGPPYNNVEQYLPHEDAGANAGQEDWHWGRLSAPMTGAMDRWVQEKIAERVPGIVAKVPAVIPIPLPAVLPGAPPVVMVNPRTIVDKLLKEVMASPTRTLGALLGTNP